MLFIFFYLKSSFIYEKFRSLHFAQKKISKTAEKNNLRTIVKNISYLSKRKEKRKRSIFIFYLSKSTASTKLIDAPILGNYSKNQT